MSGSLTIERRNNLAQILLSEGSVKVGQLASRFGVSTETIRKDLIYLERKGIATKGHGGAIVSSSILTTEQPLLRKTSEKLEIKNQIARAATDLIPERGVVILDTGSTSQCLAQALSSMSNLTIITNALNVVQSLSGTANDVFMLGGKFNSFSLAMVGHWGVNILKSINADIVFLGADGLSGRNGPCTASYDEAEIKKEMVRCASTRVVISDSTKFSSSGLFQFSSWDDIDYLITDSDIPEEEYAELRTLTNVIIVEKTA